MSDVARLLEVRKEELIDRWVRAVERTIAGGGLTRAELVDHMPAFVDELASVLRSLEEAPAGAGGPAASARIGAAHGVQRYHAGASLPQIVREYGLLRDLVLGAAREAGVTVSAAELAALLEAVDVAVAQAVSDFGAQREASLREYEARLASLADQAQHAAELLELGDAFFELDRTWRIVRVNGRQEAISRKPRSQTVGRTYWEVWPELAADSLYTREYRRVMDERVASDFEDYYAPLDLWTSVTAYPVTGGGMAVFFRDVTARRRAELAREQAREFERQLLGIVSHDLRNPLNAIVLGADALLRRGGLDDRQTASVARILASGQRAGRLIVDLLDFGSARMGGGIELRCERTDLAAAVREALDELASVFPERTVRLDAGEPVAGEWDRHRLAQVISNLVTNAFKYGAPGSTVTVRVAARGGEGELSVHNVGAPIDPALLEHVFEPYQRGASQDTPSEPPLRSVGLGLFIVRHIVEAHRGHVTVTSSTGAGTTFTVRLPLEGACAPPAERSR
ncbi:MAG: ATP-binding protein [Anaeromyxobacteraceae bacterium]